MSVTVPKNLRDGKIVFKDGNATPKVLQLDIDEGNLTFEESQDVKVIYDRASIHTFRKGRDQPTRIRFSFKHTQLHHASTDMPRDFMLALNGASNATSADTGSDLHHFKLEVYVLDPTSASAAYELLAWDKCVLQSMSFGENDEANMIECEVLSQEPRPTLSEVSAIPANADVS